MPSPLVNRQDRVLVPMRAYLESLGASVSWQPPDRVEAELKGRTVAMTIGSTTAQVDGRPVTLDVPAQLIDDRTYLPVRFLSEGLGAKVDYDNGKVLVQTNNRSDSHLEVFDGPLNVRTGPSTGFPVRVTVPTGTVMDLVRQNAGWAEVSLADGATGWVATAFTRPARPGANIEPFAPALNQKAAYLQMGGDCLGLSPVIEGKFYVPLRQTVERLGGRVEWQGGMAQVTVNGLQATLTPGQTAATVGGKAVTLQDAPVVMGGQVLVGARALSDLLHLQLAWSEPLQTATLASASVPAGAAGACNLAPAVNAYLVMDLTSGLVLSEYRADKPYAIASTTKVMTGLLAVEQGKLQAPVTTSRYATTMIGTKVYLRAGEQRTLQEMLYGLMLVSGNDAATAIAEHLSGTEDRFAGLMNQRATQLGAKQTRFFNASGLDDWVDPFSTAHDLALIGRQAAQNPLFRAFMSPLQQTIPGPAGPRQLVNKNEFIKSYAGATGMKNGWTEKADHTLVATAYRDGRELLVVVLGAKSKPALYAQAAQLMDHGFQLSKSAWLLERQG